MFDRPAMAMVGETYHWISQRFFFSFKYGNWHRQQGRDLKPLAGTCQPENGNSTTALDGQQCLADHHRGKG
ncbi:hypothetical protein ACLOJK_015050, partial [Asimina triloba]